MLWIISDLQIKIQNQGIIVYISCKFAHKGGQACVLQGSSSGTGLVAESHSLSRTSSSVCRFIHRMTLCWEPAQRERHTDRCRLESHVLVFAPSNQRRETQSHSDEAHFCQMTCVYMFYESLTFATGRRTLCEFPSPPHIWWLRVQRQVSARRDSSIPVRCRSSLYPLRCPPVWGGGRIHRGGGGRRGKRRHWNRRSERRLFYWHSEGTWNRKRY